MELVCDSMLSTQETSQEFDMTREILRNKISPYNNKEASHVFKDLLLFLILCVIYSFIKCGYFA